MHFTPKVSVKTSCSTAPSTRSSSSGGRAWKRSPVAPSHWSFSGEPPWAGAASLRLRLRQRQPCSCLWKETSSLGALPWREVTTCGGAGGCLLPLLVPTWICPTRPGHTPGTACSSDLSCVKTPHSAAQDVLSEQLGPVHGVTLGLLGVGTAPVSLAVGADIPRARGPRGEATRREATVSFMT